MARLILHIGTHKTGTTAIQHWLAGHRAALGTLGWHYGATDRPPHPRLPKHSSLYRALLEGRYSAEEAAILADHAASGLPDLILSEEGLSLPAFRRFAPLRGLAEHFDVTVVALFRRQDIFLESHWRQLCKEGQTGASLDSFLQREWTRQRMRYDRILDFWAEFASIRAARYDPGHAGGAVGQVLALVGLPLDPGPVRRANPSLSPGVADVCARLTRNRLAPLVPVVARVARGRGGQGSGISMARRAALLAEAAPGNARLADRYGIYFDPPDAPAADSPVPASAQAARDDPSQSAGGHTQTLGNIR